MKLRKEYEMSRFLDTIDGHSEVVIKSMSECRQLINDICMSRDSDLCMDYPSEDDCMQCRFFEKEDGAEG